MCHGVPGQPRGGGGYGLQRRGGSLRSWPIYFFDKDGDSGLAWSGGAGSRRNAKLVKVTAGETATVNAILPAPARIMGNITGLTAGTVQAYDAFSGDPIGQLSQTYAGPGNSLSFEFTGLATSSVILSITRPDGTTCWPTMPKPARGFAAIQVTAGRAVTSQLSLARCATTPTLVTPAPRRFGPTRGRAGRRL